MSDAFKLTRLLSVALGRKLSYRLGRALYMHARGDIPNDYEANGESMVQASVVRAAIAEARPVVCFDVGANVGAWSRGFIEQCNRHGLADFQIYAFEPVEATWRVLHTAFRDDERICCERLALSSSTGEQTIYVGADLAGSNSMHWNGDLDARPVQVEAASLHEYCTSHTLQAIDLLKCDAEGHDMEVILGAMPLLRAGTIAVLQFEYNHRWIQSRHFLKDAFDAIADIPYKLGKVGPRYIEVYDRWHHEHERFMEANYVLIRYDALRWLPMRRSTVDSSNTFVLSDRRR